MKRTTIAVDTSTRDALAAVAQQSKISMDEALRTMILSYQCQQALERLDADPEALAEYRAEAQAWAELDAEVIG